MDLYGWGANSRGQLGSGRLSEYEHPMKLGKFKDNVKLICGAGHSIILDDAGDLRGTGWNSKGQLTISADSTQFIDLKVERKFKKVSCGWDSSAGITENGRLFVWGSNSHGQLGLSEPRMTSIPIEFKLPIDDVKVKDVQFGLRFIVILTESNKILIAGSLKHFRSSEHEIINASKAPLLQITPESEVKQIACGQNHIIYLDTDNQIHALGDNKFNQCSQFVSTDKVVKIAAGWTHNGFLTESKELFMNGRNNYGQLGNGTRSDSEKSPQRVGIHPVADFALGAEHGILLSNCSSSIQAQSIFTWGWNEHFNCGNGSEEDVLKPGRVNLPDCDEVVAIAAGAGFCMALCNPKLPKS